jgi:hypothetical protein
MFGEEVNEGTFRVATERAKGTHFHGHEYPSENRNILYQALQIFNPSDLADDNSAKPPSLTRSSNASPLSVLCRVMHQPTRLQSICDRNQVGTLSVQDICEDDDTTIGLEEVENYVSPRQPRD